MTESVVSDPGETSSATHLNRVLGLPALVLFGMVYMVPLTIFSTYGIVTDLTGGRTALAYIVTLLAMLVTAQSYARMSVAYPFAGSAYVYAQRTFGGAIGFISGWTLLLDYLFLPMINYVILGIYMNQAFPAIPQWVFVLVAVTIVTVLNIIGIVSVARANMAIIAFQSVFIVVFLAMVGAKVFGAGHTVNLLAPFTGDGTKTGLSVVFAGAAILCLSFLGFDSVSTLSEEAREPTRTVPRAIIIVPLLAGLLFVVLSTASQLVFPSNKFESVDAASVEVINAAGGSFLSALFIAGMVAGCIGSALTSQASVARILYAMGRDGVLPRAIFGKLSARFLTPVVAILIVSAVSLLALVIDLTTLSNMISFGALAAFSVVNLAVVKHYLIDRKDRSNVLLNVVLPVVGFFLTVWLWTNLSGTTFVVGLSWMAAGVVVLGAATGGFRKPTPMLDLKE